MRLEQIMETSVDSVASDEPAQHAWERMRFRRIHHLVVVRGSRVVGVLSDRDLG